MVSADTSPLTNSFSIVCIGASAGGMEAMEQFFDNMPTDTGMGFVVIQHLDPNHKSMLVDILSRHTSMQVLQAEDGMSILPDQVYVIPPARNMALLNGRIQLMAIVKTRSLFLPIDFFLDSLAQDRQELAICIILSGAGADGSQGLKTIKSEGGIVFAQSPDSATHEFMPHSAISTGLVDMILTPESMGATLADIAFRRYRIKAPGDGQDSSELTEYLQKIFVLLRFQTGHDFSQYKVGTIRRRVERRMLVNQIDRLSHYIRFLQQSSTEVETLFHDLLIGVTGFFRDPQSFSILEESVLPALLSQRKLKSGLRIWSPGCATGEEAYSIAMLIHEVMAPLEWQGKVQIFATDIDRAAIDHARKGFYSFNSMAEVSEKRRRLHFKPTKEGFHVRKVLRDMIVFAEQDLIKDPPFSELDLIICRNLLIYFNPELQRTVLPLFYHALKQNGYLFLGTSENIGPFEDHFKTIDAKNRIFQRQGNIPRPLPANLAARIQTMGHYGGSTEQKQHGTGKADYKLLTEQALLNDFTPATALINSQRHLLYSHGPIGDFLSLQAGEMHIDILNLVHPELRLELRNSLSAALAGQTTVEKETGPLTIDDKVVKILLTVLPLTKNREEELLLLVAFHRIAISDRQPDDSTGQSQDINKIKELESEIQVGQQQLFTLVEEAEIREEESRSIQEELQSANQELQSINEEMETSREELQSTTEELITVNQELEKRVLELSRINDDMVNLLASTDIGIVFLDPTLSIKRFTPAATKIIGLQESDEGRPIRELHCCLQYDDLQQDLQRVLETLEPLEKDGLMDDNSGWYTVRILPYRTVQNVIDGLVLSFIDTSRLHLAEEKLQRSLSDMDQVFNTAREGLMVIDMDHHLLHVNDTLLTMIGRTRKEILHTRCEDIFHGPLCHRDQCVLARIKQGEMVVETEVLLEVNKQEMRFLLSARPFLDPSGELIGVVESFFDITDLYQKEQLFSTLFEQAPDAILWIDALSGRILRTNLATEKLLGWSRDELKDMHHSRIHHPDTLDYYKKVFADHCKRGGIFRAKQELLSSDGRILQCEVVAAQCEVKGRKLIQSIYRDLSKEQETQQQLILEREKIAQFIDMSSGLFVVIASDETIEMINAHGSELLGYPQDKLLGANWFDTCIPERFRTEMRQVFARLMQGKVKLVSSYRNSVLTADGRELLISWQNSLLVDAQQRIIGTLSAGLDISTKEALAKIISDNERLMTAFFEEDPDYCYMVSPNGLILNVNKAAAEMLGKSRDELIGKPLKNIYSPSSQRLLKKTFAKWKKNGFLKNEKMFIVDKSGQERAVLLNVGSIRDESGNIVSSVSVQRDISEVDLESNLKS